MNAPHKLTACIFWVFVALSAACGDGSDSNGNPPATDPHRCEAPDPYTSGLTKTGANGVKVTLQDAAPATATIGNNVWTLSIADADGSPIDDASLTLQGTMPLHEGHGSPVQPIPSSQGNGMYEVQKVNFNMGGQWKVVVKVSKGELVDEVSFQFCVVE